MDYKYPFLALVNLTAGGFLAAATFGFAAGTVATLGFAVSIGVVVVGLAMALAAFSGDARLAALGAFTAVIAGWTIVATSVFADPTAKWLVFGSGLGHAGLAILGIVGHEIRTEHIVRDLEVTGERGRAAR